MWKFYDNMYLGLPFLSVLEFFVWYDNDENNTEWNLEVG
jgi:hypothetical protein